MEKSPFRNIITLSLLTFILNTNYCFASLFDLPTPFTKFEEISGIDGNKYESHWQYLKSNFKWNKQLKTHLERDEVKKQLIQLSKHSNYMSSISKRAEPYLYYLSEEIYKRKLPAELALIPIVESAFDPYANSGAGASGLWQMMPRTAEHYGVKQDWWYDGRRDIIMSTNAALDYLEKLYKDFNGDWLLTIAAYNAGGGNVRKAIRKNKIKNKSTDFWSLSLPRETKQYIPKLLAFINVINKPEQYNQTLPIVPHEPFFDIIHLPNQIDLKLAAKLSNMTMETLQTLNPGFNRFATAPDGPHRIVLPRNNSLIFDYNIAKLSADNYVNYHKYTIKKGDTLIGISKKFNTTINVIKNLNNLANNTIRINSNLIIPMRA